MLKTIAKNKSELTAHCKNISTSWKRTSPTPPARRGTFLFSPPRRRGWGGEFYKKLNNKFFNRPTLKVAKDLLGKFLVIKHKNKILSGMIVETEAYIGENDLACHASKGRTPRTETLYASAGTVYVYLIYGMYYCLNIVTEKKDFPAAVLIRALEPKEGIDKMQKLRQTKVLNNLTSGPGKLCMALGIDKNFNNKKNTDNNIYIEDRGEIIATKNIKSTKRIGVDYAGECKDYLWRFYIEDSELVLKR